MNTVRQRSLVAATSGVRPYRVYMEPHVKVIMVDLEQLLIVLTVCIFSFDANILIGTLFRYVILFEQAILLLVRSNVQPMVVFDESHIQAVKCHCHCTRFGRRYITSEVSPPVNRCFK